MKITWIVDAGYLLRSSPGSFDYLLLKNQIESMMGTSFFESYYLNSTPSNRSDAQEGFNTWLKNAPPFGPKMHVQLYRLKTVRCKCPDCSEWFDRNVQQGVDVGIVTLCSAMPTTSSGWTTTTRNSRRKSGKNKRRTGRRSHGLRRREFL